VPGVVMVPLKLRVVLSLTGKTKSCNAYKNKVGTSYWSTGNRINGETHLLRGGRRVTFASARSEPPWSTPDGLGESQITAWMRRASSAAVESGTTKTSYLLWPRCRRSQAWARPRGC